MIPVKLKIYFKRFLIEEDDGSPDTAALAHILSKYSQLKTLTENISKIKNCVENLSPIELTDSTETANKLSIIRLDRQISL